MIHILLSAIVLACIAVVCAVLAVCVVCWIVNGGIE
jgi:hypothetical protein